MHFCSKNRNIYSSIKEDMLPSCEWHRLTVKIISRINSAPETRPFKIVTHKCI